MNPDRIYKQYRDDALALQFSASEYTTFVAMPFRDSFSYRSIEIYEEVFCRAAQRATELNEARLPFARPFRMDQAPGGSVVNREEIVVSILKSHLVLADLTMGNHGVLVEAGVALGLKPNRQVILVTQGDLGDLHFDIRNNSVLRYDSGNEVEVIAKAMVRGAKAFEEECVRYVIQLASRLTSDAILSMNLYGKLRRDNPNKRFSLHEGVRHQYFKGEDASIRFHQATRELLVMGLLETEYEVGGIPGGDAWGMHATKLGWAFIEYMWKELHRT